MSSQDVVGSGASGHTVLVTGFTLALIVVLGERAFFDTKGTVADVATDAAVTGSGTKTLAQTFLVTLFTDLIPRIIDPVGSCVCV